MNQVLKKVLNVILNPIMAIYSMLIISFASQIGILYEPLTLARRVILLWGIILLGYLLLKKRNVLNNKYSFVLLLFCISNYISVLINYSERFVFGIITMAYVSLYLLVFFNVPKWNEEFNANKGKILKEIININIVLSFITAVCAIILFAFNVNGEYVWGENVFIFGMRENRLWGLYNANTAATICFISMVCSFIHIKDGKWKRFSIINIVIQTIYLILTQSRTGWILVIVFLILYLFFYYVLPLFKAKEKLSKKIIRILGCVLVIGITWNFPMFAREILVKVPQAVTRIMEISNSGVIIDGEISLDRVDEEFLGQQDVTNGRLEIWKAGMAITKDNPVFGIGSENVIKEAEQYLSEDRYQNLVKGGFHNSYLSILVSSGIVGMLLFCVFLLMLVYDGMKRLWKGEKSNYSIIVMLLFTLMVNELMEARWLYNTSYLNIVFWIFAGFVVNNELETR